jgi:hypothetical protein
MVAAAAAAVTMAATAAVTILMIHVAAAVTAHLAAVMTVTVTLATGCWWHQQKQEQGGVVEQRGQVGCVSYLMIASLSWTSCWQIELQLQQAPGKPPVCIGTRILWPLAGAGGGEDLMGIVSTEGREAGDWHSLSMMCCSPCVPAVPSQQPSNLHHPALVL